MAAVENHWGNEPKRRYYIDGLTLEMPFWRFNLRSSNTEPLLRLNVESRGLAELVTEKVSELERVILTDSCSRKIN
jgi:phosphomannomutase